MAPLPNSMNSYRVQCRNGCWISRIERGLFVALRRKFHIFCWRCRWVRRSTLAWYNIVQYLLWETHFLIIPFISYLIWFAQIHTYVGRSLFLFAWDRRENRKLWLRFILAQLISWNMSSLWLCMNIQIAISHWTNCDGAASIEWNRTCATAKPTITSSTGIKISFYSNKKSINGQLPTKKNDRKTHNNYNVLLSASPFPFRTTRFLRHITLISWTSSIYHDFPFGGKCTASNCKIVYYIDECDGMRLRRTPKTKTEVKWRIKE